MPTDLETHDPGVVGAPAPLRLRSAGTLLLVAAAWNVWVWVTRIINQLQDPTPRTTGFLAVHAVLYVVSLGFAVAIGIVGWRLRRAARSAT